MTIRKLPTIKAFDRPDGYRWDAPSSALDRWVSTPAAAGDSTDATISIFDVIGEDSWTGGGFTAKRMSAALRSIGDRPVTLAINSPGGDMFEGLAIYNMLKDHKAEVTVNVLGLAASAASIIAMAGDNVQMGQGSFLMIHNAWGAVVGNQHDMRAAADLFAPFDAAMAEIYASRTGVAVEDITGMMDAETFMGAKEAIALGFADRAIDAAPSSDGGDATAQSETVARRRLDALLAKQGVPRSERRKMYREAGIAKTATGTTTPCAGSDEQIDVNIASRLLSSLSAKGK